MEKKPGFKRYHYWFLLAFAFTAVASIALQNLIWVAVAFFLFYQIKTHQKFDWPRGLFPSATLLFLATFFLGAILGIDPANSFRTVHKYLTILLIFPIGAMALYLNDFKKLFTYFVYGALVCAVFGIGKHFILHESRIDSFSGDKMVFGGLLMLALLIAIFLVKNKPENFYLWSAITLIGTALILTETRGAWLGFLVGLLLLISRFSRKWLLISIPVLLSLFLLLPHSIQDRFKSIGDISFNFNEKHQLQNSPQTRFLIWAAGLNIIKDYPWGVGQGNLENIYPRYKMPNADLEPTVPHLHNNFLQITAQNGWIGLGAYLFWISSYYFAALKLKSNEPETREVNWLFLCLYTSILIWGLTEYTFSHQFMNVQFFLLGLQVCLWRQSNLSIQNQA